MVAHSSPGSSGPLPERIGWAVVFGLAWPMMISRMSDTLMLVVDTLFVSRLGTDALAGIGIAISGCQLVIAFGWGLIMGVRVAVSHHTGADRPLDAARLGWQGVWMALALGVVSWLALPLAPWAFSLTGAGPEVTPHALSFFRVRVSGAPLFFGLMALSGYFQGRGDTRTPMIGTLLGNALNIALNPVFVFGWGPAPELGAGGAALATVISQGVNLSWLAWRFQRLAPRVSRRPDRALFADITRPGLPMGLNLLQEVGSFAMFMSFLAHAGAIHLAAHVVVVRIVLMSFLPGWAVGEAGAVLVGQSLGAGRPELARQSWRAATTLALSFMTAFGVLFVAAPEALLSIFSPSAEVLELGVRMLWIAAAFQVFDALATVGICCLNGAGDNRFTMALQLFGAWLLKVPMAWFFALPLGLGAPGAWLGMTLDIVLLAGVTLWRIRGDRWLSAGAEPERRLSEALA